jgi:hypothetical protein
LLLVERAIVVIGTSEHSVWDAGAATATGRVFIVRVRPVLVVLTQLVEVFLVSA